jgi:uncharacterized protein YaeQ
LSLAQNKADTQNKYKGQSGTMAGTPFRCSIRLTLSDLDRNVYGQRVVNVAQFPDEPDEHILLRFLAHTLWFEESLEAAQGWEDQHEPDLKATDLTGALTLWIECGEVPLKRLVKALGRSKTARFLCVFAAEADLQRFAKALRAERPRHTEQLEMWLIPADFMAWLESVAKRNMAWTATISEGTLYLDCDGHTGECLPERRPLTAH